MVFQSWLVAYPKKGHLQPMVVVPFFPETELVLFLHQILNVLVYCLVAHLLPTDALHELCLLDRLIALNQRFELLYNSSLQLALPHVIWLEIGGAIAIWGWNDWGAMGGQCRH